MAITFERGSEDSPKGHAFVYVRSSGGLDEVWASYIVMLPVSVDLAKYMPPFLLNQMGDASIQDMSAFAFPPAPEMMEGMEQLDALAEMRNDDVLFAGTLNTDDVPSMMMAVGDAVQAYSDAYNAALEQSPVAAGVGDGGEGADALEGGGGFAVNEVMYGLMSDADKLNELSTLVSKLRFAVDSGEEALVREAEADIGLLSRHLDFDHKTERIVSGVKRGDDDARRLTMLYVQRCYCIVHEDYLTLGQVEEQIAAIEAQMA